jgi:ketosteroid isomerase-like protein
LIGARRTAGAALVGHVVDRLRIGTWSAPRPGGGGRPGPRVKCSLTVTDNKEIVQRFWDALAARDWNGMKALLTDDAHYTDVGTPGPGGTGPEGVIGRLKIGIEPLQDYSHQPGAHMIGEGNLVMTEHTERWTFHTGETFDHSFVSVTELRNGKICRWHDYSNIANITDNAPAWWLDRITTAARE